MIKFDINTYLPISSKAKIDLFFKEMRKCINQKRVPKGRLKIFLDHIKRPTLRRYYNHKLNEFILEKKRFSLKGSETKLVQQNVVDMVIDPNEDILYSENTESEFVARFSSFDYTQADYSRSVGLIAKKN